MFGPKACQSHGAKHGMLQPQPLVSFEALHGATPHQSSRLVHRGQYRGCEITFITNFNLFCAVTHVSVKLLMLHIHINSHKADKPGALTCSYLIMSSQRF